MLLIFCLIWKGRSSPIVECRGRIFLVPAMRRTVCVKNCCHIPVRCIFRCHCRRRPLVRTRARRGVPTRSSTERESLAKVESVGDGHCAVSWKASVSPALSVSRMARGRQRGGGLRQTVHAPAPTVH